MTKRYEEQILEDPYDPGFLRLVAIANPECIGFMHNTGEVPAVPSVAPTKDTAEIVTRLFFDWEFEDFGLKD